MTPFQISGLPIALSLLLGSLLARWYVWPRLATLGRDARSSMSSAAPPPAASMSSLEVPVLLITHVIIFALLRRRC